MLRMPGFAFTAPVCRLFPSCLPSGGAACHLSWDVSHSYFHRSVTEGFLIPKSLFTLSRGWGSLRPVLRPCGGEYIWTWLSFSSFSLLGDHLILLRRLLSMFIFFLLFCKPPRIALKTLCTAMTKIKYNITPGREQLHSRRRDKSIILLTRTPVLMLLDLPGPFICTFAGERGI